MKTFNKLISFAIISMTNQNLKFLVCCANGSGSSLMAQMALEKVLKKNNIKPGKVHHCPLSEGKSSAVQYDVLVCAQNFANMFEDAKAKGVVVIPLKNVMSAPEIETKLKENGIL